MYNGYKLFRGFLYLVSFLFIPPATSSLRKVINGFPTTINVTATRIIKNTQHQPGRQPLTKNHDTKEESRHRFECSQDSGRRGANGVNGHSGTYQ